MGVGSSRNTRKPCETLIERRPCNRFAIERARLGGGWRSRRGYLVSSISSWRSQGGGMGLLSQKIRQSKEYILCGFFQQGGGERAYEKEP